MFDIALIYNGGTALRFIEVVNCHSVCTSDKTYGAPLTQAVCEEWTDAYRLSHRYKADTCYDYFIVHDEYGLRKTKQ